MAMLMLKRKMTMKVILLDYYKYNCYSSLYYIYYRYDASSFVAIAKTSESGFERKKCNLCIRIKNITSTYLIVTIKHF